MIRRFSLALACCAVAFPQTAPESATKDEAVTFKTGVNLVLVPVVVRDRHGRAVGTLKQDDFQLFDKGKPQIISRFVIERSGALAPPAKSAPDAAPATAPAVIPDRYVAYLFDDVHANFIDLARARDAAWEHIRNGLRPTDRGAVFSTSGQTAIDFTDDKDALHATLMKLLPRPINMQSVHDCPEVGYYLGDLIQNKNDPIALQDTTFAAMACSGLEGPGQRAALESIVRAAALRAVAAGSQETRISLGVLRDVIRRMGSTPGQRNIILASPGFVTPEFEQEKGDIIDRAVRNKVTINALDVRGLWVDPTVDGSRPIPAARYVRDEWRADEDVLAELANGSGGKFFHNNNDLAAGFRELEEIPEYSYILGFSPQNLKLDGTRHALKVALRSPAGLTLTARQAYYAPRRLDDPVETAKEEIREAIFSREELREIPVVVQSQFFKPSNETAHVTVKARVDLKGLKYRKVEDRNVNDMTVTFALFDRNGNYVTAVQRKVEMRLKDETLARPDMGIVVQGALDVKPGLYLIRVVVRDSESQSMTALNGAAEIP